MRNYSEDPHRRLDLRLSQNPEQSPIFEQTPPTELFDAVQTFPWKDYRVDYPFLDKDEFIANLQEQTMQDPTNPHFIVIAGSPAQGKTTFENQLATYLTTRAPLAQFARKRGYRIKTYHFAWGDGFDQRMPQNIRMEEDYHSDSTKKLQKRIEVRTAEDFLQDDIEKFIIWKNQQNDQRTISLVFGDIPLDTGIRWGPGNNRQAGVTRGLDLLENLVHHNKRFSSLRYGNVSVAGLCASWPVRLQGIKNREIAENTENLTIIKHKLESMGVVFSQDTQREALREILKETAPPAEISRLLEDTIDVVHACSQTLVRDYNFQGSRKRFAIDHTVFGFQRPRFIPRRIIAENHTQRTRAIGETVIPAILLDLDIPPAQATVLYNGEVLNTITMHGEHMKRRISGIRANYMRTDL